MGLCGGIDKYMAIYQIIRCRFDVLCAYPFGSERSPRSNFMMSIDAGCTLPACL